MNRNIEQTYMCFAYHFFSLIELQMQHIYPLTGLVHVRTTWQAEKSIKYIVRNSSESLRARQRKNQISTAAQFPVLCFLLLLCCALCIIKIATDCRRQSLKDEKSSHLTSKQRVWHSIAQNTLYIVYTYMRSIVSTATT